MWAHHGTAEMRSWQEPRKQFRILSGLKHQADTIQTMALASWCWSVIENVAQMAAASPAMHFCADTQQFAVRLCANRARQRVPKRGPPGSTVVLGRRWINGQVAPPAMIRTSRIVLIKGARPCGFSPFFAHDFVLQRRKSGAPFRFCSPHFKCVRASCRQRQNRSGCAKQKVSTLHDTGLSVHVGMFLMHPPIRCARFFRV